MRFAPTARISLPPRGYKIRALKNLSLRRREAPVAISITGEVYGMISPLVKGGWIFLTVRSEKDWGILIPDRLQ